MNKLNLKNYVAEKMLHEIYTPKKYEKECEELPETCGDYTEIEKILKWTIVKKVDTKLENFFNEYRNRQIQNHQERGSYCLNEGVLNCKSR